MGLLDDAPLTLCTTVHNQYFVEMSQYCQEIAPSYNLCLFLDYLPS